MKKIVVTLDKILEAVWLALILLVPLAFSEHFVLGFEFPKMLVLRTGVIVLFGVMLLKIILERKIRFKCAFYSSPVFIAACAFMLVLGISTFFGVAPITSFFGSYDRQQGYLSFLYYFIFFIVVLLNLKSRTQIMRIFFTISLAAMIVSAYGILQKLGIDPLFKTWVISQFLGRIFSTLGQPNFLAQMLALTLPVSVGCAIFCKRRCFFLIATLFSLAALVFTLSRSAVLGLIVALFIALLFRPRLRIAGIVAAVLIIAGFIFTNIFAHSDFVSQNYVLSRMTFAGENMRSIQSRIMIWPAAVKIFSGHPVFGSGVDTFGISYPKHIDPRIFNFENLHSTVDRAHNEILDFAVSGGVFGMAAYLAIFITAAVAVIKYAKNKPRPSNAFLVVSPFLGIAALFITNIFGFSMTTAWMFLWLYLAVLIYLLSKKKIRSIDFVELLAFKIFFGISVALLSSVLFIFTVLAPALAEINFRKGRLAHEAGAEFGARNFYKKAINYAPRSDQYYYWLAQAVLDKPTKATLWEALKKLEKVPEIASRNLEYLIYRARLLEKYSDAFAPEVDALPAFTEAAEFAPNNPRAQYFLGNAFFKREKYPEAIAAFEKYLEIAPKYWQWKNDIETRSFRDREKYRIFYKLNPSFNKIFKKLSEAYLQLGNHQKVDFYQEFAE